MEVMTDELWDELDTPDRDLHSYLFLEPHESLVRQWKVEGTDPTFLARMDGAISRFGAVSVWDYEHFADEAAAQGYTPVFMEDPAEVFDWRDSLNANPGVSVNSKLEGRIARNGEPLKLVNGFLPFQAVGLNFMRACDRAVYFQWSTGTGKTLAAEGTILIKKQEGFGPTKDKGFDLCCYVVKPNNLYNTRKKLIEHTGLEARILGGPPKRRERLFAEADAQVEDGEQPILIFNAEKFRDDKEDFKALVEDRDVLIIIDEMPEKYANRTSQIYRATAEVFYTSYTVSNQGKSKGAKIYYPRVGDDRTSGVFWVGMCATPIRNAPEDFFNSIRIMDSRVYGSIDNFNNNFVGGRDPRWHRVTKWKNLDLMGAMAAHIVHQADKRKDPAIAAQFPEVLPPETDYCDMDPATEKLYAILQKEYSTIGSTSVLDFDEILAAIGVFQMLCNNPRSVLDSALRYEAYYNARVAFVADHVVADVLSDKEIAKLLREWDKKNRDGSEVAAKLRSLVGNDAKFTDVDSKGNCVVSKLVKLRERIDEHDDKVIVFSAMNEMGLPYLGEWLDKWGITYVEYHGEMSPSQKQTAQDAFRQDPSIKVFLGTDAGKDSIDLPEADLTIHYDEPWTWAGREQRENRQHRIDSEKQSVQTITLRVPNTVEDRKMQIIETKKGYHDQVLGGEIADQAEELTKTDFLYILTGKN